MKIPGEGRGSARRVQDVPVQRLQSFPAPGRDTVVFGAGQPSQNQPPRKPNRMMLWILGGAAALGLFSVMGPQGDRISIERPYVYQEVPADAPRPPEVYPGPRPGSPEVALPDIARTQRNIVKDVDEALDLARRGHLQPDVKLMNYRGMIAYEFTLRTGKAVYLPVPQDEAENRRLVRGISENWEYPMTLSMEQLDQSGGAGAVLISLLPTLLFLGLMIYLMRNMLGLGGKGGLKPPGLSDQNTFPVKRPNTRFEDIGGYPEVVTQLQEVLEYVQYVKAQNAPAGATGSTMLRQDWPEPPKGILLTGPPGTGKTLMAKAIAGEAGVPFISVSGSDFVEIFVGVGASRVKKLFAEARKQAQANGACIVFIDEIDALGKSRAGLGGVSGGNDEREQTLQALLVEMDGFGKDSVNNIIVMAATNQENVLDPALVRSGRFDVKIEVGAPVTPQQRREILEKHCQGKQLKLGPKVDLMEIARLTPGSVGADLEGIVKEAKRLRWQEVKASGEGDPAEVAMRHFRDAIQNVKMGPRRHYELPAKDRETIGIHEVLGHGLVGEAVGIPPIVISMIARNKSLGHVIPDPQAMSSILPTLEDKLKELLITMGGQAAETVMNGPEKITPGASMDYMQARGLVKNMLTSGMFRGFSVSEYRYADQQLAREDREFMNNVLEEALETAVRIIEQVPADRRRDLLMASLQAGELQGEEAMNFYRDILGPGFDWTPMHELARAFIADPSGKKRRQTASPKFGSARVVRLA